MEDGSASIVNRPTSMVNATSEELLDAYGITAAPLRLATSAEQAASIAAEIGFPVVMKIASPEIAHKSDAGGVLLNVKTRAAAMRGFSALVERARGAKPEARLEGVHVQKQVPGGQDVIMGVVRDPQFGPLVMFGSGGIEVEALHDTAFALAPLSESEAEALIGSTWAGRKLSGFRSIPPADREAVRAALVRLSHLACDIEGILEIEINPLRALAAGAVALDVRMRWDAEAGHARPSPSIDPE